jgi:hypothetical protein
MKHLKPTGAGIGILLAAALVAGCGGGGHSASPLAGVTSNTGTGGSGTTTQSGASAPITVTVNIPPASQTASARRNPAYVSPATSYIQAYALPSNTSNSATCSGSTCTLTLQAPLTTTSIKVQLFGSNNSLLSMATEPVTIVQGAANAFTFVFDGIVNTFHVFSTLAQGVVRMPQTGIITVVPYDAAGDEIMAPGPGNLIDPNGNILVSANGATQTMSLSTSGTDAQYLTFSPLTWNVNNYNLSANATYNDGGAGTGGTSITISATSSVSGAFSVSPFYLPVNVPSISIIANPANPTAYQVTVGVPANPITNTTIEFPTVPTPSPVTVGLSVVSNFEDVGATLSLNNDTCTTLTPSNQNAYPNGLKLDAAFPTPMPATMPAGNNYPFSINMAAPAPNGSNSSCTFTITESSMNLEATATFGFDNTTLVINGKKRK